MKKLIAITCMLPVALAAQNHEKACDIFSKVNFVLQEAHIKPKPVDDSLSVYVFNTVMNGLDEDRMLFIQEDVDKLSKHKYLIDNYIKNKDCSFFNDFISIYKTALARNKENVTAISSQQLPGAAVDTLYFSKSHFPYHKDAARIRKFIRKKLIHDIFEDIAKQSKNRDSLRLNLVKLAKASQSKIVELYLCRANTRLNPPGGFENSMYNRFFSAFCSYYDPHSTYLNNDEKTSFMSSISTENYSLGLIVSKNDNEEIIVEDIVPGGPAYKSNKISKGDQIITLISQGKEYSVNCATSEMISNIVLSDDYKKIGFTLRKNDGTVYSVMLEKAIMKAEDHSVYSFILSDRGEKVGYIKVPSFYSAADNSIRGCADDVAKEITKLKKDNVNGIILDLQYNGGGSMEEAIKLSGMFIDYGPLAIVSDTRHSFTTIKDQNRGTFYNGPLVVIVNNFSASASEFFAGIMQDYNRALVAGSTTLGKATMQTIIPLDEKNPKDFVKVTIDKFYRVTGKSSQYTGIKPDVVMPVFLEKLMPRESTMPNAMANDSINMNLRYKQLSRTPLLQAAELSKKRIKNNSDFAKVEDINNQIDNLMLKDKKPLLLTFDAVFEDVHSMDSVWKSINEASEKEQPLTVDNTSFASEVMMYDSYLKSTMEHKINALKKDPYIYESLKILYDLNKLTNP
ncbi:hypothetical protein CHU92_14950 [Flavobacterium cyanobacteriorum]|uniref:PDZ domain-containing protein n=1 Tax=Flavobacterium cyanobacteriorum TaxID=2022802 RepID=A0A255YRX2_9FLAO|nr:carboxy terminal-processing peptidase [Flavobacterium cyanobacteriorum]OYQ31939.1 hypothetical protein CHU92_14950 [Flavobacterium cyanobacteriorum]